MCVFFSSPRIDSRLGEAVEWVREREGAIVGELSHLSRELTFPERHKRLVNQHPEATFTQLTFWELSARSRGGGLVDAGKENMSVCHGARGVVGD